MEVRNLLQQAREIWGDQKLTEEQIVIRMGKIFGDLCRHARNEAGDQAIHNKEELEKEIGNMIFSTIRWADDLGLNPEVCIQKAIEAQRKYIKIRPR
jgi:hypothetical protein